MTSAPIDYEAEFDSTRTVPDFAAILAGWAPAAAAYRGWAQAELGLAYGPKDATGSTCSSRTARRRRVAMFIHGGFWMSFDGSHFSHRRRAGRERIPVAVPTYSLCPT
jgi:arylformamidase